MGIFGGSSKKKTVNTTNVSNQTVGADNGAVSANNSVVTFNSLDEESIEKSFDFARIAFERSSDLSEFAIGALSAAQINDQVQSTQREAATIKSVTGAYEKASEPDDDITQYIIMAAVVLGLGVVFVVMKGRK